MSNRYAVIMAGGRGERFWPLSRLKRPKHLLPIVGDRPMLAQTIARLGDFMPTENILVITNAEQREAVLEVCPQLAEERVIAEPVGRDTAAAAGLAAILVKQRDPQAAFAVLPADHVIRDTAGFCDILSVAFETAETSDTLVTIGIKPDYPATGYGYIQKGAVFNEAAGWTVYEVNRFEEKPDLETAREYVSSGEYYWNAGMFVWRVPVIAQALETHAHQLWQALLEIDRGLSGGIGLNALLEEHYIGIDKISIDHAVMEKAGNVVTIESAFDWDDVGEWPALARHDDGDNRQNIVRGRALVHEGSGNIVVNESGRFTALVGTDELIVIQTPDATLVCPKAKAQEIKKAVHKIIDDPGLQHLT